MSYALVRPTRLDLDSFARVAGLHPELVRRLAAAGALDAHRDAAGTLWFSRDQLVGLGRIQRLRAAFALNYAALGLVIDLLDRIEVLEAGLRGRPRQTGATSGPQPPDPEITGGTAGRADQGRPVRTHRSRW